LLIGEILTLNQTLLVLGLLVGIFLVSNKHFSKLRIGTLERGVWTAILATIGMGFANFLFGFGSRATDPIMLNWFPSAFMALATLLFLLCSHQGWKIMAHLKKHRSLIFWVGFMDNLAWVTFAASTLYLPIGLATGLSESYIALAAILGFTMNKETLRPHQS